MNPADRIAPKPGVVRYVVHLELAGQRLDQGLAALAVIPRRRVRALVADGRLWLNGRVTRVLSRQLHLADVLDVVPEDEAAGTSAAGATRSADRL